MSHDSKGQLIEVGDTILNEFNNEVVVVEINKETDSCNLKYFIQSERYATASHCTLIRKGNKDASGL